jgi:hypothetical protein
VTGDWTHADWATWIDAERQAAEKRTGTYGSDAVTHDATYARALDILDRRERACLALQQAEAEARSLTAGRSVR